MASFEYLADGHHVDDAGNLIACAYVDFRDLAERLPITVLQKASSKRHAIPGCATIRISKPSCFLGQGEGFNDSGESHHGTHGWIYCASIEPETAEERAAWRSLMPAGRDVVSPIRRPREFARALGGMAAEQAGPRGRIMLLRNTVEGRTFGTAHKSQTVYHGPVAYLDNPYRRLESASSELELALLLVFLKHPAHRALREYRFLAWAEDEPAEGALDLDVSRALVDAMLKPRAEPVGGFVRPGAAEHSTVEELEGDGSSRARARVETLPAFLGAGNPAVVPRPHDAETARGDLRETPTVRAAVEALHEAVGTADAGMQEGRCSRSVARRAGTAILLHGVRLPDRRHASERGRLHRRHGRILCGRRGRGKHRRGAGGDVRVHGQCRRHASRVHGTRRAILRAGAQGAPGGGRRAGFGPVIREHMPAPA